MLAPIQGALQAPDTLTGKALFLVHVGLFLLWQPLISTERVLNWREALTGLTGEQQESFVDALLTIKSNLARPDSAAGARNGRKTERTA